MPFTIVIAEKPSLAKDIAQALSFTNKHPERKKGLTIEVGQITIVGAQGHLFSLASAEQYGNEFNFPWRIDPLPVLPDPFVLEPGYERKNGKIVNSDLTKIIKSRLECIKLLLSQTSSVVHAGDPDREGQLIIDDILREFGYQGEIKRLWLHAQTRDGIIDAWKKMKDNSVYANLGLSALARRESDWAIGINATRAYSAIWWKKGNKGVLNVGRVVTPVIGLIVQRENEIRLFKSITHYSLKAEFAIGKHPLICATWVKPAGGVQDGFDVSGEYFIDRARAVAIQQLCQGQSAQVLAVDKGIKREMPPLLLSLTELQKMAGKMGFSPDTTLDAAQSLYEKHKLTSYPRTDCEYAPESERSKVSGVISAIQNNFSGVWQLPPGIDVNLNSRAWDDTKLKEHYAIIPLSTQCSVDTLTATEKTIYRLICRQYIAQFLPDYQYESTSILFEVQSHHFKANGRVPIIEGWRILYGGHTNNPSEQDTLPDVKAGEGGFCPKVDLIESKTEPPKRFTVITLLDAMDKAYKYVTDPKVKAKLKEVEGIGTSATRAATIAKIVRSGFALEEKVGKVISYVPTAKAFQYIQCIPGVLTKPDLTAWFEGKLEELVQGTLSYAKYRQILEKLVNHVIADAKSGASLSKMPSAAEVAHLSAPVKKQRRSSKSPSAQKSRTP